MKSFLRKVVVKYVGKEKGRKKIIYQASSPFSFCKFQRRLVGSIPGWWSYLKIYIKENISNYKEIVILDIRFDGGHELIKAIEEAWPNCIDSVGPIVAVFVKQDNTIAKIVSIDGNPQEFDQYDLMSKNNNGILRING